MKCPNLKCESYSIRRHSHTNPDTAFTCNACGLVWTEWQQAEIERLELKAEQKRRILLANSYCSEKGGLEDELTTLRAENERLKELAESRDRLLEKQAGWRVKDEKEIMDLRARLKRIEETKIICLCGSTRFTEQMLIKQWELTKQGCVVLSWCALPDSYLNGRDAHIGDHEGVKELVDEIHKRKIDLADEVLILNVGGYIGESTRSELEYAKKHGKRITYLEEAAIARGDE